MFIAKLALPRRTFLRGLGATLGLPLLEAMVPAMTTIARTAAPPTTTSTRRIRRFKPITRHLRKNSRGRA